jgi:hypothetical protein
MNDKFKAVVIVILNIQFVISMSFVGAAQTLTRDRFPMGTYAEGDFSATFTKEGELIVFSDDFVKARAVYSVDGNIIAFKDKDAKSQCVGEGKYKWKFDGKALTFTKISDACTGRTRHLTSRAW